MGKRLFTYVLTGLMIVLLGMKVAGYAVKVKYDGWIAPGVTVCGRDISWMRIEEVEALLGEFVPEFQTEVRCEFLPEMQSEAEKLIRKRKVQNAGMQLTVQGKELCLTVNKPMVRVVVQDTMEEITAKSREVKVWEWLYAKVTGKPFRTGTAEAVFVWEEEQFGEWLSLLAKQAERECVDAAVSLKNGKIKVRSSQNGFRLNREKAWADAEQVMTEVTERLKSGPVEKMVLRLFVEGVETAPKLSTGQAKACDTVIGEFTTSFAGAGDGRRQNIKAGAKHLHGRVILPGEEFSVAAALMPFTEENGYAAGGTYIGGQLAESIGGGVCQLSTTLYNALLQTRLEITERYPHSMPVGYVPLGQDAAIAGDYKDLKFQNTTASPVVVSCEIKGEAVHMVLYGSETAKRENVTLEQVVTEETKENITVEVYRTETKKGGEPVRERVSVNRYRVKE